MKISKRIGCGISALILALSAAGQSINVQKTSGTFLVSNVNSIESAAAVDLLLGTATFGAAIDIDSATGNVTFSENITGDGTGTNSFLGPISVSHSSDIAQIMIRRNGATNNPGLNVRANETGNAIIFDSTYTASAPSMQWATNGVTFVTMAATGEMTFTGPGVNSFLGVVQFTGSPEVVYTPMGATAVDFSLAGNTYSATSNATLTYTNNTTLATTRLRITADGAARYYDPIDVLAHPARQHRRAASAGVGYSGSDPATPFLAG